MSKIEEGKKAPDFTLEDQDEKKVTLSGFKGKDVIVYFYPADDTPGCTKEACGFRDFWKDLQKRGVVVLGVSPDDADSHRKFISKYTLPFTLLSDPDRSMMTAWGAFGKKMMYGKEVEGTIRSSVWVGPDGAVKKHWRKVADAAKHPEQVLAALQGAEA
mgnify:CR=1